MATMVQRSLHRRSFVRGIVASAATAGAAVLAACGGEAAPTAAPATVRPTTPPASGGATAAPTTASAAVTAAPTMVSAAPTAASAAPASAATGVASPATGAATAAPMMAAAMDGVVPSPAPGVPEAYLKLPAPFKSTSGPPSKGGKVSAVFISYSAPVPGRNENKYWQELEKRLGITYEPNPIAADSYREKMAALIAGGDLPDLTVVEQLNAPELLRPVNQGVFTDLTPYLDGEAKKEFPNLARFPDYAWKNVKIKGKIYGVPIPRFIPDRAMIFRGDWAQKFGITQPKNADELLDLLTRITKNDPDGNGQPDTFGLGGWQGLWYSHPFFTMMFRAPHGWRQNPDGSLVAAIETEEYKNAIAYMKKLRDAGVFHPDAGTMTIQNAKDGLVAGKFGGYVDGWTAVTTQRTNLRKIDANNPAAVILVPPGHDGGKPAVENSQGFFGMSCIPTTKGRDKERVKELLRVLDYCAAPFGSEEYNFLRFGIEGVHYETKNGFPVGNDLGRTEIGPLSSGIARRNDVFFYPDAPDDARLMQGWCRDQMANGIDNPTYGLYSPTAIMRGGELSDLVRDRMTAIISGREPISAFDQAVKDWRSRGGDQIRKEYQDALKA